MKTKHTNTSTSADRHCTVEKQNRTEPVETLVGGGDGIQPLHLLRFPRRQLVSDNIHTENIHTRISVLPTCFTHAPIHAHPAHAHQIM